MPVQIRITVNNIVLRAELTDTACAKAIGETLPFDVSPERWGDEFYFEIPVTMPLDETATTKVKVGDIGYWPPGRAMTLFFGPTPISTGPEPVPASAVNLLGRITDDAGTLKQVRGTSRIRIEKVSGK